MHGYETRDPVTQTALYLVGAFALLGLLFIFVAHAALRSVGRPGFFRRTDGKWQLVSANEGFKKS